MTPAVVENALAPFQPLRHVYVAYSGGIDSHVLLHLCAGLASLRGQLAAVHIHHGLQPEADAWDRHAADSARALGVAFRSLRVDARAHNGESPEEAARNARYSALDNLLDTGDVVLAAHHLDDQLETVLLQLLRGAGLRGLSGIPEAMRLGRGYLLRPLLKIPKQAIESYASTHHLNIVNDPSNRCIDFDRNYLRHEILPLLKQRWPGCAHTVARSAGHCAEAEKVLTGMIDNDFRQVFNAGDKTLTISRLLDFDRARQQDVLRRWFFEFGLKSPSQIFLVHLLDRVAAAGPDRQPEMSNQGISIRRYRDKLYCLPAQKITKPPSPLQWPPEQASVEIGENRALAWRLSSAGIPLALWRQSSKEIRFRSGGEKIALPGRDGRHTLKNLYQETGIPPWQRGRMPLIYMDDRLAAVGDLWLSAEFYAEMQDACIIFSLEEPHESKRS